MKKFTKFFLALFLISLFLACGDKKSDQTDESESAAPTTTTTDTTTTGTTTTVSGTVTLSPTVTKAGGQMRSNGKVLRGAGQNSLGGADVFLFDADKPEWHYPVAKATTDTSGTYKVDKRANGNLNKNPDGSTAYTDGSSIPSGNYTVIADNYFNYAYGSDSEHYVAIQPYTKKFDGDATGNDLTAYDNEEVPGVVSMFGLPENGDGSYGGSTTELSKNVGIQITFSMAMARLSLLSAINIKDGSNATVSGTWKVSADLISATFYPASPLTVGQTYTLKVTGNAKNVYGKNLPKEITGTFKVKSDDTTPPNATQYSPSAQEGVAVNTPIQIAVNELLDVNTIKVASTPSIGDKPNVLYAGNTGVIPGKPYIYEIVPNGLLQLNKDYAITVSGAKDMAGNSLTAFTFNFKTASAVTAPTVQSTTPANSATGVSIYSAISAVFTSQMNASTINAQTFTASGTGIVNGSVTYNPITRTAVFTPSASLSPSTAYTATITTGAKDTGGTPMAGNHSWSFTTGATLDTTLPTTPTGLVANAVSSSRIDLSWTASTDNVGVTGYSIWRDGVFLKEVTGTSASDTGLSAASAYCYEVSAFDAEGNDSILSTQSCANTLSAPDTTAPSTPTALIANAVSQSQINLSWTASTDNVGVAGYKVYRGGTWIANSVTTAYSNTGLTNSTSYCYTVSAYDATGNTSSQSGQACATTQVAPGTVTTLASGLSSPYGIAVDATSVYWTENTGGTLNKVGLNGGTVTTLASGLSNPNWIALDTDNVYWTDYNGGAVKKVGKSGGTVTTLASGSYFYGTAVDSTSVYWAGFGSNGSIKKVGINGGSVTTLVSGINAPHRIALDATSVYWSQSGGTEIKKVGINGGSVTVLASGLNDPQSVAVDLTNIYWAEYGGGVIKKTGINGGSVTTLASGLTGPSHIAIDGAYVYWTENGNAIKKVSKEGGTVTTISSGLAGTGSLAVDDTSVYWTEYNGGTVKKVAKGNFKLPDTGQTGDYTTTFGEDSDYTINPMSFTDNGNSTITDNNTGLVWQKEDDNVTRTWADAGTYCDGLSLGGQTDWRLPDEFELMSIVDYGTYNPAVNTTYFPNTSPGYHWSSHAYVVNSLSAWYASFYDGHISNFDKSDNSSSYVKCVRGDASPAQSFTDNGNGTVTDNNTALVWQKEDDNTLRTWEQALTYCEGLSLVGDNDWRLPNIKELESITDATTYNPAINTLYFPNTNASYYWSSTTFTNSLSNAWYVDAGYGYIGNLGKSNFNFYVRCVRGGP